MLEDGEDSSGAPAAMNGYEGVGNGAVDEDQVEHSHGFGRGSFSQNEGTNNKWEEEEEDWEVQQKQDGMTFVCVFVHAGRARNRAVVRTW